MQMHKKSGHKTHPEIRIYGLKMRGFTTHPHTSITCKAKSGQQEADIEEN